MCQHAAVICDFIIPAMATGPSKALSSSGAEDSSQQTLTMRTISTNLKRKFRAYVRELGPLG